MNVAALSALACPHCREPIGATGPAVLGCANGHRFDVARQGYVALLGARSRTDTGDSADMVAARVEFLSRGHYAALALGVAAAAASAVRGGPVLEVGAGTGYYLGAVLDGLPGASGIALDSSRYAARRSAADPRVLSVLADAWSVLPVQAGSVFVALSVFAPRDLTELARVLRPAGVLVAVTPEPEHLSELRGPLDLLAVDGAKADRLADRLTGLLELRERHPVSYPITLTRADAAALVRMGPAARHLNRPAIDARVAQLAETTEVRVAVTVSVFVRG